MRRLILIPILLLCGNTFAQSAGDKVIIRDGDVEITEREFQAVLETSPEKVIKAAAGDFGDRFELLNGMIINRKLAAEADATFSKADPEYWDLHFKIISLKEKYMFDTIMSKRTLGNYENLTREVYDTRKDHYALVPEARQSSHILFKAFPGVDRTEVRLLAAQVLTDLRNGADFEQMVAKYSEDPGSAKRGGSLNRDVVFGDKTITPPYSAGLFEIERVGEYSDLVESQFGVHVIRLDGVTPSSYKSFDEVKAEIYTDIVTEVRTLSSKEIRAGYHISDDAFVDGPALDRLFSPYLED